MFPIQVRRRGPRSTSAITFASICLCSDYDGPDILPLTPLSRCRSTVAMLSTNRTTTEFTCLLQQNTRIVPCSIVFVLLATCVKQKIRAKIMITCVFEGSPGALGLLCFTGFTKTAIDSFSKKPKMPLPQDLRLLPLSVSRGLHERAERFRWFHSVLKRSDYEESRRSKPSNVLATQGLVNAAKY